MNVGSDVLLSTFLLSNASWLMELFCSGFGALTQQSLYVMFECRLIVTLCLFDTLQTSDLSCLTSAVSQPSVTKSVVSIGCLAI